MLGIFDRTVARKLVRLLTVFATALTVALTGEAAVAARRLANLAQREHQVDEREHRVGALGLLLRAAAR